MSLAVQLALNLVLRGLGSGDGKGEGALAAVALSPHGGAEALPRGGAEALPRNGLNKITAGARVAPHLGPTWHLIRALVAPYSGSCGTSCVPCWLLIQRPN